MADQPPSVVDAEILAARDTLMLPDAEQLELIRDETPGRDAAAAVAVHRKRGRPPNARNRRNQKFRDFVLSQHSHPGIALARIYDRPVELLAAELECKKVEAAAIQARAAAELLPYIEGKAPISVEMRRRNDVVLIMPGSGMAEAELTAIASRVNDAEEIDWDTAEALDVLAITSGLSGHETDVPSIEGEQSES
jgi:hypothetical protein